MHLFMIAMMFVLAIIWIIRNRAWELEITIEWPYCYGEASDAADDAVFAYLDALCGGNLR